MTFYIGLVGCYGVFHVLGGMISNSYSVAVIYIRIAYFLQKEE